MRKISICRWSRWEVGDGWQYALSDNEVACPVEGGDMPQGSQPIDFTGTAQIVILRAVMEAH
jgi:hypothetical protein